MEIEFSNITLEYFMRLIINVKQLRCTLGPVVPTKFKRGSPELSLYQLEKF